MVVLLINASRAIRASARSCTWIRSIRCVLLRVFSMSTCQNHPRLRGKNNANRKRKPFHSPEPCNVSPQSKKRVGCADQQCDVRSQTARGNDVTTQIEGSCSRPPFHCPETGLIAISPQSIRRIDPFSLTTTLVRMTLQLVPDGRVIV